MTDNIEIEFFKAYKIPPKYSERGVVAFPMITDSMLLDLICLKSQLGYKTKASNVAELKERTLYTLIRERKQTRAKEGVAVIFKEV